MAIDKGNNNDLLLPLSSLKVASFSFHLALGCVEIREAADAGSTEIQKKPTKTIEHIKKIKDTLY